MTVLQDWPAIGHLDASDVAQGLRLAWPGKRRLPIQKFRGDAPGKLLTHLNIQSFVLPLDDGAQRAMDQRYEGQAHGQIVPGSVGGAAEQHHAPKPPGALHHRWLAVSEF